MRRALVVRLAARQSQRMIQADPRRARRPRPPRQPAHAIFWLGLLLVSVELVLQAADLGLFGATGWRSLAYQNGAFWAGLLDNWRPNYAAQPWLMFLTYSFLHVGLGHLLGNLLGLLILAAILLRRMGQGVFLALYVTSAVGGGLGFALLSDSAQPMVGASGALFGLVGAWKYGDWAESRQSGVRVFLELLGFAALNLLFWLAEGGFLAWESHLGGFVAGWIFAVVKYRVFRS